MPSVIMVPRPTAGGAAAPGALASWRPAAQTESQRGLAPTPPRRDRHALTPARRRPGRRQFPRSQDAEPPADPIGPGLTQAGQRRHLALLAADLSASAMHRTPRIHSKPQKLQL